MTTTATHTFNGPIVASGTANLPFTFQAITDAEVGVTKDGVELFSGYAVNLNPDGTGHVTPLTSWGSSIIYIFSRPAFTQETSFSRMEPFYPDELNHPFDILGRQILALRSVAASKLPLTGGTITGPLYVPDEPYSGLWDGNLSVPTKNALFDKIETMASEWGDITGNIYAQTDLQNQFNTKADLAGGNIFTGDQTVGGHVYVTNLAYGVTWNGSNRVPTMDAVYDKIESVNASIPPAGVTSFNTRVGAVTLIGNDVTTALGYTPANISHTHPNFTASVAGFAPASGGGTANYLRADGNWVTPTAVAVWGSITGTLSNQTDLQTALNGKANVVHTHVIADTTGLQAALDAKVDDSEMAAMATDAELAAGLATKAPLVHTHVIADVTGLTAALDAKVDDSEMANYATDAELAAGLANYIPLTQKGAANGVVPLDGATKISATYLPSYVDDVVEYANLAAFPATGETGKIYVALDTGKTYRWTGSAYTEISSSSGGVWGTITGTLSNQTDLQTALNGKVSDTGDTMTGDLNMSAADITVTDGSVICGVNTLAAFSATFGNSGNPGFLQFTSSVNSGTIQGPTASYVGFKFTAGEYSFQNVGGSVAYATINSNGIDIPTGATYKVNGVPIGGTTSIVGITGTLAQFNTAITDADIMPVAGGTFTGDISVPAEAYSSSWNGSNEVPTKNDVYDKIEAVTAGGGGVTTFNTRSGAVTLTAADVSAAGANAFVATGAISGSNLSGTNTGDQTSIVGISGTLAQFDTALTDHNFAVVGRDNNFTTSQSMNAASVQLTLNPSSGASTLEMMGAAGTQALRLQGVTGIGYVRADTVNITKKDGTVTYATFDGTGVDVTGTIKQGGSAVATVSQLASYAVLAGGNTFTGDQIITGGLTVGSGATAISMSPSTANLTLGGSSSTGQVILGAISGTGTITVGRSTLTQTVNVAVGATASASTKTINLGTGGVSGSTTNINVGSSAGGTSNVVINGTLTLPATTNLKTVNGNSLIGAGDIVISGGGSAPDDTAFAGSWDGVTTIAPSKNAVYDKIAAMDTTIAAKALTTDLANYVPKTFAGSNTVQATGASGKVIAEQTGGQFGGTRLTVQSINGCHGAEFESIAPALALVDFSFKTSTGSGAIRYERRSSGMLAPNTVFEFQIGTAGTPEVRFGDSGAIITTSLAVTGTVTSGGSALATVAALANYLPLTGGNLSGPLTIAGAAGAIYFQDRDGAGTPFILYNQSDGFRIYNGGDIVTVDTAGNMSLIGSGGAIWAKSADIQTTLVNKGSVGTFAASNAGAGMEVRSSDATGGTTGAWLAFHRPAATAIHIGLDVDNLFKIGGWSWSYSSPPLTLSSTGSLTLSGASAGLQLNDRDGSGFVSLYCQTDTFRVYGNAADRFTVDSAGNTVVGGNLTVNGTFTHTQAATTLTMTATNRIVGRTTAGAGAAEELTAAQALTLIGAAPDLTGIFTQSTSLTASNTHNNQHGVFSGAARVLTLNSTPSTGTSFTGRFTTAWTITCTSLSKNGAAAASGGSIAANSLISFLHEGAGTWVASGQGLT